MRCIFDATFKPLYTRNQVFNIVATWFSITTITRITIERRVFRSLRLCKGPSFRIFPGHENLLSEPRQGSFGRVLPLGEPLLTRFTGEFPTRGFLHRCRRAGHLALCPIIMPPFLLQIRTRYRGQLLFLVSHPPNSLATLIADGFLSRACEEDHCSG